MIIRILGTNGSGKSTVVRMIMAKMQHIYRINEPPRRKPSGNVYELGSRRLYIPGHYDIGNGGIDTFKGEGLDYAYDRILEFHRLGNDVLYEGQNREDGIDRSLKLVEVGMDIRFVLLTTPVPNCIAAVRNRGSKMSEDGVIKCHKKCIKIANVLEQAGAKVIRMKPKPAATQILKWLENSHD